MAKKFSIKRNPTFAADVSLPVVGGEAVKVKFQFKWKDRKELMQFHANRYEFAAELAKMAAEPEVEAEKISQFAIDFELSQMREIVAGWDIEEEFNDENLIALVESSSEVTAAIVRGYLDQYEEARKGN